MAYRKLAQLFVAGLVLAGIGAGGVFWWRGKVTSETTDNAYVQAETVSVSPQIEGYVAEILVADNQAVSPGQVLVRLDPSDAQTRLDRALARAEAAEAAVRGVDDNAALHLALIREREAGVAAAEAAARQAELDLQRYGTLAERGFAPQQMLQESQAGAAQTAAAVAQANASLAAEQQASRSLGSAKAELLAEARAALAEAEQARIDLDRTVIRAPVGGVVGARSVRPGQFVRPGAPMLAVVPLGETYIVANFKETQVSRLRIGQPVEIRADAFGGEVIEGHIESFAPATGAEFALIPVENAVGNFTKIAQRLPVRIAVERDAPLAGALRPGLSVKIKVDVTDTGGISFADAVPSSQMAADGAPAAP
jgi:membrane fusion protein (multidrug efflux system)